MKGKLGVNAEWHIPTDIVVYEPGIEMLYGSFNPLGTLFEGPNDVKEAAKEHRNMVKTIAEKSGAKIHRVNDLLVAGTKDSDGNAIEGERLEQLRNLARISMEYNYQNLGLQVKNQLEAQRESVLRTISPEALAHIVLTQPTYSVKKSSDGHTETQTLLSLQPVYNLMFMRDQMITTPNGIIIGNMNSLERQSETKIVEHAIAGLGITPLARINNGGKLEGGDYIPMGQDLLIGTGARTNAEGINQLVENFNTYFMTEEDKANIGDSNKERRLVVIHNSESDQDRMHLDTYMNVLDKKTVVIDNTVLKGKEKPRVEVYAFRDGKTKPIHSFSNVMGYFESKGVKVIETNGDVQANYGLNYLLIGPKEFVGVDIAAKAPFKQSVLEQSLASAKAAHLPFNGLDKAVIQEKISTLQSLENIAADYTAKLIREGGVAPNKMYNVVLNHLNQAYGSIHCCTQVIGRTK